MKIKPFIADVISDFRTFYDGNKTKLDERPAYKIGCYLNVF